MKAIKTKIIATIGPSTNTYDSLKKLHKAGMNVARINMSHATHTDAQNIIDMFNKLILSSLLIMVPSDYCLTPKGLR